LKGYEFSLLSTHFKTEEYFSQSTYFYIAPTVGCSSTFCYDYYGMDKYLKKKHQHFRG